MIWWLMDDRILPALFIFALLVAIIVETGNTIYRLKNWWRNRKGG